MNVDIYISNVVKRNGKIKLTYSEIQKCYECEITNNPVPYLGKGETAMKAIMNANGDNKGKNND